jgi:small subunit ribosomal protein S2
MTVNVKVEDLVEVGAHFGHQSKRWNPKMEPYIYAVKDGVHIFDLTITKKLMEEALRRVSDAAKKDEAILLLGTKKQAKDMVEKTAKEAGVYWVNERWLGGTLTNFKQIKKSLMKLKNMREKMASGEYDDRTKKERLLLQREINRLERFFGGISGLEDTPEILFVIDSKKESGAIAEANDKGVDVVAVVDTNADPVPVDYPIPMNDDATKSIEYILDKFKEAVLEGKSKAKSEKTKGVGEEKRTSRTKSKKSGKKKTLRKKSKKTSKKGAKSRKKKTK